MSVKKDYFGASIGIDGNYIVVGAKGHDNNKGAAYIFDTTTGKQLNLLQVMVKKMIILETRTVLVFLVSMLVIGAKGNDDYNGAAYIFNVETGELYKKLVRYCYIIWFG